MDLTKSNNPNSITLGSAKIEITTEDVAINKTAGNKGYNFTGLLDLGLARGVSITPSSTKIEISADNGTVPIKGQTGKKVTVAFSLLERHIPTLGKIMGGLVTVKATHGVEDVFTDTFAPGTIKAGKAIPFSKFNFNGAAPEDVELKQGIKTLAAGVDYDLVEYAGAHFFILKIDGEFDDEKALTATYKVTPAESYTMSQGSTAIAKNLAMKLTNKRKSDDGRIISRSWELPYGFCVSEDVITLKSKNDGDNVSEVPLSFEFTPHPDLVSDSDLEVESLIREVQEV